MIVFIGFSGVGKSTLGREYAKRKNLPFFDSDLLIESRYQKSPKELISYIGIEAFRVIEERLIISYLNNPEFANIVFSLGGGAIESKKTRKRLRHHTVIYLRLPLIINLIRLKGDLRGFSFFPLLQSYKSRKELYQSVANYTIYNYRLLSTLNKLIRELY